MMRPERNKDRKRHYCTCRNQNDCVLSHGASVHLQLGRFQEVLYNMALP
jgi:hypothetical protein